MYILYSMRRYARTPEAQPLTSTESIEYGISGILSTDTAWDSDMIFVCNCDSSWPVGLAAGQVLLHSISYYHIIMSSCYTILPYIIMPYDISYSIVLVVLVVVVVVVVVLVGILYIRYDSL